MSRPFAGVFEKIEFPPYTFREYPKWLTINGVSHIVRTQREEIALISETPEAAINDPVVVEKNRLAMDLVAAQREGALLRKQIEELQAQAKGTVISIPTQAVPQVTPAAPDDPSTPVELKGPLGDRLKEALAKTPTTAPGAKV